METTVEEAKKYLLDIGFDDSHLSELFNDDDKSYYTIPELMEHFSNQQNQSKDQRIQALEEEKNQLNVLFKRYDQLIGSLPPIKNHGKLMELAELRNQILEKLNDAQNLIKAKGE